MPVSGRLKELGLPNPVKGKQWREAQAVKLSSSAVGRASSVRNSEGYFTTLFSQHADPYEDPAKIQKRFTRNTSGRNMVAPRGTKLPGQGFDDFKSLYTGHVYEDPIKIRIRMKKEREARGKAIAPKRPRPAFKTSGGNKTFPGKYTYLLEVDSKTGKSRVEEIKAELQAQRISNRKKTTEPPNFRGSCTPSGGFGVSGQLIGRKNISYSSSPFERLNQVAAERAAEARRKQEKVHGSTPWHSVPVNNPNSSLVTSGTFSTDTALFGLDEGTKQQLEKIAAVRAKPIVLTFANWLSKYRLIKFEVCTNIRL